MSHNHNHNKNRNIVKEVHNLDDFLDLTDSEDTSSSSDMQVFEHNNAFVLELHELKRDELPDNPLPEVKTRKLLKKKKRGQLPETDQSGSSLPSSSMSESSVAPVGTDAKEEFYDAHESYHALPDNETPAVTSVGVLKVVSENNAPKVAQSAQPAPETTETKLTTPEQPPPALAVTTTLESSTAVTKPVTPPPK